MALVYLDPGHVENTWENTGGKGVTRGGTAYEEYHFNKPVAERAQQRLKDHGIDARITSRSYADQEDLTARTDEANRAGADLLVSIHANAGAADGACIFYWPGSEDFANIWINNWRDAGLGVALHGNGKHAVKIGTWTNLHMVREAAMPAYLIEHGYMTDDQDFKFIFGKYKSEYRDKAAEVIVQSVCQYFNIDYKREGLTVGQVEDLQHQINELKQTKLDAPSDASNPSGSHDDNVEWAKQHGLTNGKKPRHYLSREQLATILHAYDNRFGKPADWVFDTLYNRFDKVAPLLEKPDEWKERVKNHDVNTAELTGLLVLLYTKE